MGALLDKARVGVLGNMHKLLDKVANTPEAYAQRIRDLEEPIADLRAAHDEVVGTLTGYRRDVLKLENDKATKDADIELLLGDDDPTNDSAALTMQVELADIDEQIASLQDAINEAEASKADLDEGLDKLNSMHREMQMGLKRISHKAAVTKFKNKASSAAEAAVKASNAAAGASIDNIEAKIDHANDVSDARFDRVFGKLKTDESPEQMAKLARARAALEARRAKIATEAVENTPKVEAPAATA